MPYSGAGPCSRLDPVSGIPNALPPHGSLGQPTRGRLSNPKPHGRPLVARDTLRPFPPRGSPFVLAAGRALGTCHRTRCKPARRMSQEVFILNVSTVAPHTATRCRTGARSRSSIRHCGRRNGPADGVIATTSATRRCRAWLKLAPSRQSDGAPGIRGRAARPVGRGAQAVGVHLHHALRDELDHLAQQVGIGPFSASSASAILGLVIVFPPLPGAQTSSRIGLRHS